jgi:hypothetical protein
MLWKNSLLFFEKNEDDRGHKSRYTKGCWTQFLYYIENESTMKLPLKDYSGFRTFLLESNGFHFGGVMRKLLQQLSERKVRFLKDLSGKLMFSLLFSAICTVQTVLHMATYRVAAGRFIEFSSSLSSQHTPYSHEGIRNSFASDKTGKTKSRWQ